MLVTPCDPGSLYVCGERHQSGRRQGSGEVGIAASRYLTLDLSLNLLPSCGQLFSPYS